MTPSWALTGWAEIEPGAVQKPEEQPGLDAAALGRELSRARITDDGDGSGRQMREKSRHDRRPKVSPVAEIEFSS